MSDFKDKIRTASNDSAEYALRISSLEDELIGEIAVKTVEFVKSEIERKASAGEFTLKDGKHRVSGYFVFHAGSTPEEWIKFYDYTKSLSGSESKSFPDLLSCKKIIRHEVAFKQVEIKTIDYTKGKITDSVSFKKELSVSVQEKELRRRVKELLQKDAVDFSAQFIVTKEKQVLNPFTGRCSIKTLSQEILSEETITVQKQNDNELLNTCYPVFVGIVYKYDFEY